MDVRKEGHFDQAQHYLGAGADGKVIIPLIQVKAVLDMLYRYSMVDRKTLRVGHSRKLLQGPDMLQ